MGRSMGCYCNICVLPHSNVSIVFYFSRSGGGGGIGVGHVSTGI